MRGEQQRRKQSPTPVNPSSVAGQAPARDRRDSGPYRACGQRATVGFFVHGCNALDDEGHDRHLPRELRVGARRGYVSQVRSRTRLYLLYQAA